MQGAKAALVTVLLQPIGEVEEGLLAYLGRGVELRVPWSTCIAAEEPMPIPAWAYDEWRRQYLSPAILRALKALHGPKPFNFKVLGVADVDAYTPGLNFVLGEAEVGGSYAVIYLARLRLGVNGHVDRGVFLERALKEAVHELGHTFGLPHCPNPTCVMRFSNSVADTDYKTSEFCESCRSLLANRIASMVVEA